jgi:hypothetical protein
MVVSKRRPHEMQEGVDRKDRSWPCVFKCGKEGGDIMIDVSFYTGYSVTSRLRVGMGLTQLAAYTTTIDSFNKLTTLGRYGWDICTR